MLSKVLVAEDHELANVSVQKTLEESGITDIDYAYYCDDALLKIQHSRVSGDPYDLLITDLNFEADDRPQQIKDGISLITACRQQIPGLKIIVFSVESKPALIDSLLQGHQVDGYVRKSRNDRKELRSALECIKKNQRYFPRHLSQVVSPANTYQFTEYDITIISLLAGGIPQKNIPACLLQKKISPSSLSSVEKRLNLMKIELGFTKNEQLIAFCKDMGII